MLYLSPTHTPLTSEVETTKIGKEKSLSNLERLSVYLFLRMFLRPIHNDLFGEISFSSIIQMKEVRTRRQISNINL